VATRGRLLTSGRRALAAGLTATLLATFAVSAAGQTPTELVTDRPDATESAVTVPRGSLQLELGAVWARDRVPERNLSTFELPGALARIGLLDRLELRVGWSGWTQAVIDGGPARVRTAGLADPEVGVKWSALRAEATDVALITHLTLPIGDEIVGGRAVDPSVVLTVAHALRSRASLGWNAGYELRTVDLPAGTRRLGRWTYSAALGFDLASRWGIFAEVYGDMAGSDPEPSAHVLDGGVTWQMAPLVQFDVAAGIGLNREAPDRVATVGLSVRWLK
jgi:hypothetical protein